VRIGNFTEIEPGDNVNPRVNTEVLLGYNQENLYVSFICYEPDVSSIRKTLTGRDKPIKDDVVLIILDTFNDGQMAYEFGVNPYGIGIDIFIHKFEDLRFDTDWKSAAKIFHDRWEVEIKIPFNSIRFPRKDKQHWRVHFERIRPRESREVYSWAPISRDKPSFLAQAGNLYIEDRISAGQIVEFLPYITGSQNGYLEEPQEPASFVTEYNSPKFGVTGKYGISSNLVLDWAVNPDYSQIETDNPKIDVNTTFAFYYPEKRPFFMEGSDIFASPINGVYTRSINDPIAALKLTGKFKRTSIGYITAYDKHTPWIVPFRDYSFPITSEMNSYSNILRIRQHILKDSYIGFLTTSRKMEEGFSRVTGIDGNIRFLENYSIKFQGLKSWYKEPADTSIFPGYEWLRFDGHTSAFDGEKFDGTAYKVNLSRGARIWKLDIWHEAFSPTFRADNGFIDKNDFKEMGLWTNLDFWLNKSVFEKFTPEIELWRRYDYTGDIRKECIHPWLNIFFRKQTIISLSYTLSSEVFEDTKFDDIWTIGGQLNTDFSKFISGGVWGQVGKGINYCASPVALGDIRDLSLWLTLKPTSRFSSSFNSERYWLWESEGGKEAYDVTVFQNKTSYQFTKHFSIRLVTQYQSDNKNIGIYPLLSFELNPFTVFYLGSNHALNKFDEPYGYRERERRIFVKFRYLFEY